MRDREGERDRRSAVATLSASQARQRSTGGDTYRPRKRGSAPRVATLIGLASEAALQLLFMLFGVIGFCFLIDFLKNVLAEAALDLG